MKLCMVDYRLLHRILISLKSIPRSEIRIKSTGVGIICVGVISVGGMSHRICISRGRMG